MTNQQAYADVMVFARVSARIVAVSMRDRVVTE
jgi:hypothetical protein